MNKWNSNKKRAANTAPIEKRVPRLPGSHARERVEACTISMPKYSNNLNKDAPAEGGAGVGRWRHWTVCFCYCFHYGGLENAKGALECAPLFIADPRHRERQTTIL